MSCAVNSLVIQMCAVEIVSLLTGVVSTLTIVGRCDEWTQSYYLEKEKDFANPIFTLGL